MHYGRAPLNESRSSDYSAPKAVFPNYVTSLLLLFSSHSDHIRYATLPSDGLATSICTGLLLQPPPNVVNFPGPFIVCKCLSLSISMAEAVTAFGLTANVF